MNLVLWMTKTARAVVGRSLGSAFTTAAADLVFTTADALAAGITQEQAELATSKGHWRRLRRGAYCLADAWDSSSPEMRHVCFSPKPSGEPDSDPAPMPSVTSQPQPPIDCPSRNPVSDA
jgi:hypothetical protein